MTIAQLQAYVESINRWKAIERLNSMSSFRVAQHANTDDYSRIIDEIKRDT